MKNFNEIYEKIYKNNITMMGDIEANKKEVKKTREFSMLALGLGLFFLYLGPSIIASLFPNDISLFFIKYNFSMLFAVISFIYFALLISKSSKMNKIDKQLNSSNIKLFLKEIDSNLIYIQDKGITSKVFNIGELISISQSFYSEDYIEGTLNNKKILMSDVCIDYTSQRASYSRIICKS